MVDEVHVADGDGWQDGRTQAGRVGARIRLLDRLAGAVSYGVGSHIKPWAKCETDAERLDVYKDALGIHDQLALRRVGGGHLPNLTWHRTHLLGATDL